MSKRLLVLVAVAAVALALVFWLAQGFGTSVEGRSRPETAPDERRERPAPAPASTELENPLVLAEEPEPAVAPPLSAGSTDAPTESSARRQAASHYQEELAQGRWVQGHVIFPEGTPLDEKAFVVAKGRNFEHGPEHKVEVARDGSFRVAFSEKTRKGRLLLEARHLYLENAKSFDVRELATPLVLEPKLGGCILGKLALPPDGSIPVHELAEASAQIHGDSNRREETFRRSAKVEALAFEFTGLPADDTYSISLECQTAYARDSDGIQVAPGETRALELELLRGVTIEGRVVDEHGAPLSEVQIQANSQNRVLGLYDWRHATTAEGGTFRMQGLGPGDVTLHVKTQGFEGFQKELGALEEGQRFQDLELVLKRGFKIAGRVLWPDGSPADASIVVQAENPGFGAMPFLWNSNFKTKVDGTFEANGLVEGTYRVEARGTRTAEVKETSPLTGKERTKKKRTTWRSSAEHVPVGTLDLELKLDPGLVLYGTVRDDLGASVDDFQIEAEPDRSGRFSFSAARVQSSFKDSGGSFELTGFMPGLWNVVAKAKGHGDSEPLAITVPDDLGNEIELVLPRAARIEGVVLDPAGRPVARAEIVAIEHEGMRMVGLAAPAARADESGFFVLERVAPGAIQLHAISDLAAPSDKLALDLAPGETRTGVELRLRTGGRISGEVVDANGRGERDHRVGVQNWDLNIEKSTTTDASGRFVFEHLPAGQHRVSAAPTSAEIRSIFGSSANENPVLLEREVYVELAEGEMKHVVLTPPVFEPVRMSGIVTVDKRPLGGAHLWASGSDGRSNLTQTNEDGSYALTLPTPGTFEIGVYSWEQGIRHSTQVEVPKAAEFTFDVAFSTGKVTGIVRGPGGKPLPRINVQAERDAGEDSQGWSGDTVSDSEGAFELRLSPGTYALVAGRPDWDESSSANLAPARVEGVVVSAGAHVTGIDLVLREGGAIEGTVRLEDGSISSDVHVLVWNREMELVAQGQADAKGRFRIDGIEAGWVDVTASRNRFVTKREVDVEVRVGGVEQVELVLVAGTQTSARVVDSNGVQVSEGVEVVLVYPNGGIEPAGLWEDRWWLGMLPAGEYTVRASWLGKTVEVPFELSGEAEREIEVRIE